MEELKEAMKNAKESRHYKRCYGYKMKEITKIINRYGRTVGVYVHVKNNTLEGLKLIFSQRPSKLSRNCCY